MVEIKRNLYMDENAAKIEKFYIAKKNIQALWRAINDASMEAVNIMSLNKL